MATYLRQEVRGTSPPQWIDMPSNEFKEFMQWIACAEDPRRQYGSQQCRRRFVLAIRGVVPAASRMLELPNPASVWMLLAYRLADAVRHRENRLDSTETSSRKIP